MKLLTRDKFRILVFERDNYKCVICKELGVDAHHIIERRLWINGGYYLCNGSTLCSKHHLEAEQTILSCEEIRSAIGIEKFILPEHLYKEYNYDKWGNIILPNGNRLVGELFYDESVQKVLQPVLDRFSHYVKYPRTYHVPWSQEGRSDDKYLKDMSFFENKRVIVTEKMDGENTTMYNNHIHARSITSSSHPTRKWVKGLWGRINWEIPERWRICGENLYAKHTVEYDKLDSYFLGFSIWDEKNTCLSWDETMAYLDMLDLHAVPVLFDGIYDEEFLKNLQLNGVDKEGWVIRIADSFLYKDFRKSVAKYVGDAFVVPHGNWMNTRIEVNGLK